ncbi:hypothetical protein BDV93DRAFT_573982 [Ceratobasidium sp. AG-I]|nr:hypothetical protein BDV93DRAFT_573982 [Ceratobasidium sp. AG-I]
MHALALDQPEDLFAKFKDDVSVYLAVKTVSTILVSISTVGVAWVTLAIVMNGTVGSASHKKHRHYPIRERMLLGLFVSHLWTGIIALALLIASLVHPAHIPTGALCDAEAIITSTGALTIHFWTIVLAIVTYLGLTHPLGATLIRVEHAWFAIGLGIYIIAVGVSLSIWALGGATYLDGYCEFGRDVWVYGELVNLMLSRRSVQKSLHDSVSLEIESGQPPGQDYPQTDELGDKLPRPSTVSEGTAPSSWGSQVTVCPQPRTPGTNPISVEPIRENMADFINRKARMLVLLFPLSYTILVIVSLAKLIHDMTHSRPNAALHAAARWTLFLQGGLDALTYAWAAARLKRAVRRLEEQRPQVSAARL